MDVEGIRDLDQRVAIVEKRGHWEEDPNKFSQEHAESEQAVSQGLSLGPVRIGGRAPG